MNTKKLIVPSTAKCSKPTTKKEKRNPAWQHLQLIIFKKNADVLQSYFYKRE
jgi:hypothetical protein